MPEQIENKMVVDSYWEHTDPKEIEQSLKESGFHECGTNIFVPDSEAFDHALDCCLYGSEEEVKEFRKMLVEWYYSGGNWRREDCNA